MTSNIEIVGINRTQVICGADQTVFVTPHRPEGYAFRTSASFCKVSSVPTFLHGERGDIVTFPQRLSTDDIRRIGKYANAGETIDCHYPDTPQALEEHMHLARLVTGLEFEQ